jgi:hypothetical protein
MDESGAVARYYHSVVRASMVTIASKHTIQPTRTTVEVLFFVLSAVQRSTAMVDTIVRATRLNVTTDSE